MQAAQNRYVKRYMEEFSNTPLELTVTLRHLQGVVTLNIPRPPSDRIWCVTVHRLTDGRWLVNRPSCDRIWWAVGVLP